MKSTSIWRRPTLGFVVFVAALAAPELAHADASSAQYRGCDGYGAASSEGDGMTTRASFLFIFNPPGYGNTDTSQTRAEQAGVEDCDAALSDLPEQHWMRKVSLLRARALHHLEALDSVSAIGDLDLAAAAVKDPADPYFSRSLGLGVDLVRALALRIAGDQTKAEALALQAVAARPYNKQVGLCALIAVGPHATPAALETIRHAIGRLVSVEVTNEFVDASESGDFAQVIALHPQLATPDEPLESLNMSGSEFAEYNWRNFENARKFWAWSDGVYAYALAAAGKADEARAAIEAGRARLASDTAPPPALSPADAKDNEKVSLHNGDVEIRERSVVEGKKTLDTWAGMVDLRIMVLQGKVKDAMVAMRSQTLVRSWASIDLVQAIAAALPPKDRPAILPGQNLKDELEQARIKRLTSHAHDLFQHLPPAETKSRIPSYEEAVVPFFAMSGSKMERDAEGYRIAGPDDQGVMTVSFRGVWAGEATVEELALLAAVDAARKAGKKGVVVLKNQDVRYTLGTTYYGTPVRTDPEGYQTELHVVFVDPAALPQQYVGAGWRVIDADQAYASLAPIYVKSLSKKGE